MQIFQEFGVNIALLSAQIVNFLLVMYLLKRFLYKPVLDTIKNRQKEIEKGIQNSEKAQLTLEKARQEEKNILHKAQEKSEKILGQAKADAREIKEIAEKEAKRESESLLEQAKNQIAEETRSAEEKLTKNIGTIAISLLEKSLQELFGKKEQEILLKKADEQIRKARI